MENKKIESFTGLRFFMMLAIIINHLYYFSYNDKIGVLYSKFFQNPLVAVNFFFILSGFGMMLSNLRKVSDNELKFPAVKESIHYAISHIKKLYPLYIVTILIGFLIFLFSNSFNDKINSAFFVKEAIRMFVNVLLMQSATGMTFFTHAYNGVSWFFSSLFCIYLVSPVCIFLLRKISKSYLHDTILILINLFLIAFLFIFLGRIEAYLSSKKIPEVDILVYGSPYIRLFYVLIGMNLALLFDKNQKQNCKRSEGIFSLYEILICLLALTYYFTRNFIVPKHFDYRNIIDVIIPVLIILVFSFDCGIVSRILKNNVFQLLGEISMYLYLVHSVFILMIPSIFDEKIKSCGLGLLICYTIVALAVTFGISLFFHNKAKRQIL